MAGRLPTPEVLLTFPAPNYVNPVTHGNSFTVVNSVFLGFATISLVGRLVIRGFIKKWLGWDDLFICLAFVSAKSFRTRRVAETLTIVSSDSNHRRSCGPKSWSGVIRMG